MESQTIMVCVDGSESSVAALRWAAAEARRRDMRLLIAHTSGHRRLPFRHRGEGLCADDLLACDLVNGIVTEVATVAGRGMPELLEAASTARMLVVAGPHGFVPIRNHVAVRATVPVVVVRGHGLVGRRPVAVGVTDQSDEEVLRTAFEAAAGRACGLLAVRAYVAAVPFRLSSEERDEIDTEQAEAQERSHLEQILVPWRTRFPGVPVECVLAHRSAGTALTAASHRAQLVVVGSHGHNMLASSLSGSPVPELLRRAVCPVYLARS